jgi:antitoxin (DNA-binding transcriptional repressor) of toxin-antitoxin stability system
VFFLPRDSDCKNEQRQHPSIIPIPCDHPAWSPRAARGVVRDPRRFLAALGMTSRCARNDQHAADSSVIGITPRPAPPAPLAPLASPLAPRPSRLAPLIPIPCDHPAWSPRAARGVVRDPRRFLAALGMTSRCARNDQHAADSSVIGITPRPAPPAPLAPLASPLAPRPSRLAPLIPIPCDHPAWSPRAARGVVRDPRRFLAALGMTSRCARNDQHAADSSVIGIIGIHTSQDAPSPRKPVICSLPGEGYFLP